MSSSSAKPKLLLVDDDPMLRRTFGVALSRDYEVTVAISGADAIDRIDRGEAFDLVLSDLEMPGIGGDGLAQWLAEHRPRLAERLVIVSGGGTTATRLAWLETFDATRVLWKPCMLREILSVLAAVRARAAEA